MTRTRIEAARKYWSDVKSGKRPAPVRASKRTMAHYITRQEMGFSMSKARRLVFRIEHDTLFVREERTRKAREYSMDLWSVYQWIVRSTVMAQLRRKRSEKKGQQ